MLLLSVSSSSSAIHHVDLRWNYDLVKGYVFNMYRSETDGGPYTKIKSNINRLICVDYNVTSGHTYYYVATTVRLSDNAESVYSNQATAIVP